MRDKNLRNCNEKMAGITLVALVVTIVVLLILAGITINLILGSNSIFNNAQTAKEKTDIENWKERLEVAKVPIIMEGLGKFDPDKYFEEIKKQDIIDDKEKDIIDNGDGTYEVTTKSGYVYDVTLMPNKEKPVDAKIEYAGEAGKLEPKINSLIITDQDEKSCSIEVIVSRFKQEENGTITGKYSVGDENSTDITLTLKESTERTQTFTANIPNLTKGITYTIKVVIQNDKGDDTKTIDVTPSVKATGISLNETYGVVTGGDSWTNDLELTATVEPEDANQEVSWKSSDESIATVDSNGVVKAAENSKGGNIIITATTKGGIKLSANCEVRVEMFSAIKTSKTEYIDKEGNIAIIPQTFACRHK